MNKILTVNFREMGDGKVKATLFEGTNKYIFSVYGVSMADALKATAHKYTAWSMLKQVNDNFDRRSQ